MANYKKGLGKTFDRIFGEGKGTTSTEKNNGENLSVNNSPNIQYVEKVVEVPVEKVVEKIVEVPVEKVVEKIIEVPSDDKSQTGDPLLVNINFVQANLDQPRKFFDEESLLELSESIKNYGIIEPLVVRKVGPVHYEIIAGERRLRAAKLAGLSEVPVIVKDYSDDERKIVTLLENVQREDLNSVEKAYGYKALIDEFNFTQEQVADKVGKSRSAVANSLRILTLNEELLNMIRDGILSEGHARALLGIEDAAFRDKLAKDVIENKLSVRAIEDKIRLEKLANYRKEKEAKLNTDSFKTLKIQLKDIEKQMKTKLNASLKIIPKSETKGIVEIKYDTQEELDRIYLLINSITS